MYGSCGQSGETLVVPPFIIDKTAPVIAVMYDNQESTESKVLSVNKAEQLLQSGRNGFGRMTAK